MNHGRSEPDEEPEEDGPRHGATLDAAALERLRQWVGRTEQAVDEIAAAPLRGLSATLDRDDPQPAPGTPLPPLAHWLYFLPRARQSELGLDGHAKRGGFLPSVDRKSTRLNSSHHSISYAVFCLKKK